MNSNALNTGILGNPLFAEPHCRSRRAAWRMVAGAATVCGISGLLLAIGEARQLRSLEEIASIVGGVTVLLIIPLVTTLTMMRHLRRAYRRAATTGLHEEWRATPAAPQPFLAHYALAVQRPFRAACLAAPLLSSVLFILPSEFVRFTDLSPYNSGLLFGLTFFPILSLMATWIAYVPALYFAGPLGHAVQLIDRRGGANPAAWDAAWDEAWTEPGRVWETARVGRLRDLPLTVALVGTAAFVGWLLLKLLAREHEWNSAISPETWGVLAIVAVLLGVGVVLMAVRRVARL